jgi:mRNA-degrading endonuclease toxin of MazEF toxin-antitoxin module
MIHSMDECRIKLEAIKTIAKRGLKNSRESVEADAFQQIQQEVDYLLNESHPDNECLRHCSENMDI